MSGLANVHCGCPSWKHGRNARACVFCPKLCRSACPVSNAEPRETVTPWGKMSMAYFVANESVAPPRRSPSPPGLALAVSGVASTATTRTTSPARSSMLASALVSAGRRPRQREACPRPLRRASVLAEVSERLAVRSLDDPRCHGRRPRRLRARAARRPKPGHRHIRAVAGPVRQEKVPSSTFAAARLFSTREITRGFVSQGSSSPGARLSISSASSSPMPDAQRRSAFIIAAARAHDAGPVEHFSELAAREVRKLAPDLRSHAGRAMARPLSARPRTRASTTRPAEVLSRVSAARPRSSSAVAKTHAAPERVASCR